MIYKKGMLCKHFKGTSLLEKNIYEIIDLNKNGNDVDWSVVVYTGDGDKNNARDLVIYQNVFQEGKLFARECSDISSELSIEKQKENDQKVRVQPLTKEEIKIISGADFINKKIRMKEGKIKQI